MTTLRIEKGLLPAEVKIPSSKSYANRALILAALKRNTATLKEMPEATDVGNLVEALGKAGLDIHREGSTIEIRNSFPDCETDGGRIETGEGGTTARFLAALLLLGKKPYTLVLGKRLRERPWDEFLEAAASLGAFVRLENGELHLRGPVSTPPRLSIDCSRTTQFATAFDLVFPSTEIRTENLHSSQSYLLMNEPLKEHFLHRDEYVVPADWSSAAFPMCFAALNQTIVLPGLRYDPFQADAKLLGVLNDLGAVETVSNGLLVKKILRPSSVTLAMNDCLDLFPAMAFLLSHVEGRHELSGISNLVHKESDRLSEITKLLGIFGRKCTVRNDIFEIEGGSSVCGPVALDFPDDHRIVMTGALFLRHHGGGTISPSKPLGSRIPIFLNS